MEKKVIGNITWVDVKVPNLDDLRTLVKDHYIHPSFGDELISPSLRPHSALSDDTFFISLRVPTLLTEDKKIRIQNAEVDFVIKPHSLVSVSYVPQDIFNNFDKFFETESILGKHSHLSGTKLFYELMIHLYQSLFDHLDQNRDALRASEENIFNGKEKLMVHELSYIHQQLLRYQESLRYHDDILSEFHEYHLENSAEEEAELVEKIKDEYERVIHGLETNMSYLHELRNTNDSLLAIKQNETTQLLTVMAYISIPSSILASLFGMNTVSTPILGHPNDFWILLGVMVSISLGLFFFFKYKKFI